MNMNLGKLSWTKKRKLLGVATICVVLITGLTLWLNTGHVVEAAVLDPHPGLVGWWRFDEGSGSVAGDSSGNGNNGTIYSETWVTGKHGEALSFDGTNDYVRASDSESLDLTSEATIVFWFMPKELGRLQHLVAKNGAYDVYLHSNNRIYVRKTHTPIEQTYSNALTSNDLNKWMFVVGVYDHVSTNKIKLYINGTFVRQADLLNDITQSTSDLTIGAWSSGTADFVNGLMDDVRVYNRVLSQSEIDTLFQKGPDFSSKHLTEVPKGTTQVITTLSWQGVGSINATIQSPSTNYTEDIVSVYQKTAYSTSEGTSSMLNIKRISVSLDALPSDENWYIVLTFENVEDYRITVEVQK